MQSVGFLFLASRIPTRRAVPESGLGKRALSAEWAEFVLHRGHRDITRVTLAGADRDARRCLCIAARALHLALSCERAPSRLRLRVSLSLVHASARTHAAHPPTHKLNSFFPPFFPRQSPRESLRNSIINTAIRN